MDWTTAPPTAPGMRRAGAWCWYQLPGIERPGIAHVQGQFAKLPEMDAPVEIDKMHPEIEWLPIPDLARLIRMDAALHAAHDLLSNHYGVGELGPHGTPVGETTWEHRVFGQILAALREVPSEAGEAKAGDEEKS